MACLRRKVACVAVVLACPCVLAIDAHTATPPMGWNSYNYYSCYANESNIQINAQGLVDLGLADLGYQYVIPDCGWSAKNRTENGTITWNADLYPSGFPALGEFIHGLGLKFGVYSGAGTYQCHPDAPSGYLIQASLGHEESDAQTFASWGGDYLKYDNCFADGINFVSYVDSDPSTRFVTMANALASVSREIVYGICQWGVGIDLASWAPKIGNNWRMSNDIFNSWSPIWRITNQVVPLAKYSKPGNFNDMDMLIVGNFGLTLDEQRTHMTIWAMEKSPLFVGAALTDSTSLPAESLQILKNTEVLAINQDALGEAATLARRFSEEEYDIWAGNLTDSRKVVAVVNWSTTTRNITVDLPDAGIQRADSARDVWAAADLGTLEGTYTAEIAGHGVKLLVLNDVTPAGTYTSSQFDSDGSITMFENVYAQSSSSAYTISVLSAGGSGSRQVNITVGDITTTAEVSGAAYSVSSITLSAGQNTILVADPSGGISSINISYAAEPTFYSAANAALSGPNVHVQQCAAGKCLPTGSKAINLNTTADVVAFHNVSGGGLGGSKFVYLDYINYDLAFDSAWTGLGLNVLNASFSVNGAAANQWSFPISGGDWEETGRMGVLLEGFVDGAVNEVRVWSPGWRFGPHVVGLEVFE